LTPSQKVPSPTPQWEENLFKSPGKYFSSYFTLTFSDIVLSIDVSCNYLLQEFQKPKD